MDNNKKNVERIGNKISELLNSEVKEIKLGNVESKINLANDIDLTFKHCYNKITDLWIRYLSEEKTRMDLHKINFSYYNSKRPRYIHTEIYRNINNDIRYSGNSFVRFYKPYFSHRARMEPFPTCKKTNDKLYLSFKTKREKYDYTMTYSEQTNIDDLTINKPSKNISMYNSKAFDELIDYIYELKKYYKFHKCEIEDIIKCILIQREFDKSLFNNFVEIAKTSNPKNEKLLVFKNGNKFG